MYIIMKCFHYCTYFRFPADVERQAAWVKAIRRIDVKTKKEWQPTKSSVVCSDHFHEDDIRRDRGNTLLKCDAVPTKFDFT